MKVYRAADDNYGGQGTCWTENIEDARAYLDNPGFGGHTLYEGELPDNLRILKFDRKDIPDDKEIWNEAVWIWILEHVNAREDCPPPWTEGFEKTIEDLKKNYDDYVSHDILKLRRAQEIMENFDENYNSLGVRGYPYSVIEDSPGAIDILKNKGYQAVEYYDDYPQGCMTLWILDDDEVKNIKKIGHSQASWQVKRRLEKKEKFGSRGWYNESSRHALASRGIRTR